MRAPSYVVLEVCECLQHSPFLLGKFEEPPGYVGGASVAACCTSLAPVSGYFSSFILLFPLLPQLVNTNRFFCVSGMR